MAKAFTSAATKRINIRGLTKMNKYLWPWQAQVMIQYPWILLIVFIILAIPLSIISWKRAKR